MSHKNVNPGHQSPLDEEPYRSFLLNLFESGGTNATAVLKLHSEYGLMCSEASMRRFRKRYGVQIPGQSCAYTHVDGDEAEAQTEPSPGQHVRHMTEAPILDDPDHMLRDRGLDPADWYISENGITVNQWDGPQVDGHIVTYHQAKFTAKRKRPELILQPVRADGWKRPPRLLRPISPSQRVVVCGDLQAPFHDQRLHELFCAFLADYAPDRGVDLGDMMDFPDLSRHKPDPENLAKAQECMQTAYDIQRARIDASISTEWIWMPGNHDARLRDYEIAHAPNTYGLRRVDTPDEDGPIAHSVEHLLRLDELDVHWVDPHGAYEDTQVNLSKNLAVRHGWIIRQGSGASALKTLETTGHSVIVGHTHRQSMVYHTFHEIDGTPRQLLGVETGCMCRMDIRGERDAAGRRYPNYTTNPNWQQGFATVDLYPDGKFKVDLATYVNGTLLWRDRRYE